MKPDFNITTPCMLIKSNTGMWQQLLFAGLVFCFLLLAACSDENKESSSPTPEPDEPSIVIPDTEDTAPVLDQQGGTATVSFTAAADWTAEATAITRALDWVSVQPTSGTAGDVTLTITTQPNDTYDERNAAIVLTCAGQQTTLTVTQKQQDALLVSSNKVELEAEGGSFTLTVQANVSVSHAIEEGASWLTATQTRALTESTLAFEAAANDGTDSRQAVITLTGGGLTEQVTVYQAGTDPVLVLGQREYLVGSDGETIQVELQSNTDYEVQMPAADWLTETSTRALSAYTHYFTVAPNDTYDSRTAQIIFTDAAHGLADTVTIMQAQHDAILLADREQSMPAAGGTLTLRVQTNVDELEATCTASWLRQTDTRALQEHTLTFTVDENTAYDARRADIIVRHATDPATADTLTIVQAYRGAVIAAQREYDLDAAADTLSLYIQTNQPLEAVTDADWLSRLPDTRALEEKVMRLAVAENTGYDAREAVVVVRSTTDNRLADTVRIRQAYRGAIIVAQREYDVPGTGGTLDFTVQTNVDLRVQTDADWITQAPETRGLVEKNLCFDIAPNEGTEPRQGTITLSGGGVTQEIVVRQAVYTEPKLVRVEYRTGYTWEEAHDNLPLLYYATVYRDRYYDNGEKVTDTFVDAGHMVSLLTTFSARPFDQTIDGKRYIGDNVLRTIENDSIQVIETKTVVPNVNVLSTRVNLEGYLTGSAGDWDIYIISKLYPSDEFISAKDIPTNGNWQSSMLDDGWYFHDVRYRKVLDLIDQSSYDYQIDYYDMTIVTYDQFLVIDGRRIDFLQYQPEYHFNLKSENTPQGLVHTFECSFEFMGRNFYGALINTITQQ